MQGRIRLRANPCSVLTFKFGAWPDPASERASESGNAEKVEQSHSADWCVLHRTPAAIVVGASVEV
jgi:hypothetical protein